MEAPPQFAQLAGIRMLNIRFEIFETPGRTDFLLRIWTFYDRL